MSCPVCRSACTMYTHKCPYCGKFTGMNQYGAHWAYGEQTGNVYIYCNDECYQNMEYPWYLQEQNYHEE